MPTTVEDAMCWQGTHQGEGRTASGAGSQVDSDNQQPGQCLGFPPAGGYGTQSSAATAPSCWLPAMLFSAAFSAGSEVSERGHSFVPLHVPLSTLKSYWLTV